MKRVATETLYYVFLEGRANLLIVRNGAVHRTTNALQWAEGSPFPAVEEQLRAAGARLDWVREVETALP